MMVRMILVVAMVFAVALHCARGQPPTAAVPTSIQVRFLDPMQNGNEALDGATPADILLPIELDLTPNSALLGAEILITVSFLSGTATESPDCSNPTGGDFCFVTRIVNFAVGANDLNRITVILNVFDDLLVEGTESFTVIGTITDPGAQPNGVMPSFDPGTNTVDTLIFDNDFLTVGTDQPSYTVTECVNPQLDFSVVINGKPAPSRPCVVTISTIPGTAIAGEDYDASVSFASFTFGSTSSVQQSVNILEDLVFEQTESFSLSLTTNSLDCTIPNPTVPVTILDDEDCMGMAGMPCDENAMCVELPKQSNFNCICNPPYTGDGFMCSLPVTVGDDPHFSIVLPSGKLLCYTVQGEHGFVFNLISNKFFHMNAMFVPDSRREEVTWLGSMGIIVQNSQYKNSNATYLRFETKGKKIYIGDKVTLQAKNIEKLIFNKGKMTILETPPFEGFRYPSVLVDLQDVGLNFTIKFLNEHLDLFWHNTGKRTKESHGLIGQFFRKGVEIDTVRKILILPGKEPVPVMRRPVWSFMEREVADDQLCWTAMNPGYQGEGLIDGTYFDYLMNDILSTDFKFKKRQ